MTEKTIMIRLMKDSDLEAVVKIDEKILKSPRLEYYQIKFERLFKSSNYLPTSFVAEEENGSEVGFLMGEFGIFQEVASID